MQPFFSVGIVLFDGEKFLDDLIPSLETSVFGRFDAEKTEIKTEILIRDQSKNAATLAVLHKKFPDFCARPTVHLFSGENLLHSGGHNFLYEKSSGEMYICASQDMVFDQNFLSELYAGMAKNSDFSVFTGKILQMQSPQNSDEHSDKNSDAVIDSCGIFRTDSHFFGDIGQGEKDSEKFCQEKEIWGASGAFLAISKNAVEELKQQDGYFFDERLHYKNDVDLAYRLFWMQKKAKFLPKVILSHARQLSSATFKKSEFQKKSSCFGHFLVLRKHFFGKNFAKFSWKVRCKTLFSVCVRWLYCKFF